MITGEQLRAGLDRLGLKAEDAAERFHVNRKTITNWKAGGVPPAREAEVWRVIFGGSARGVAHTFTTDELAGEIQNLMSELFRRLARLEAQVGGQPTDQAIIPVVDPQDQWFGGAGPSDYIEKPDDATDPG